MVFFMAMKILAPLVPVIATESYLTKTFQQQDGLLGHLLGKSAQFPVSRLYSSVILINFVYSGLAIVGLSMKVGAARKELGVPLPAMYASGDDENSKKFNCLQRGHQHALETYTMFVSLSLVGGILFPISTSLFGLVWIHARKKWAEGYATGNPDSRYSHSAWGRHIWTGLLGVLGTATASAFLLLDLPALMGN